MVERMDRPLSFEEYFEQNDSRVGKSPASARKAPRSAGAVYEERTPRRSASARERAAPATGTPYRSAPSPHRAGARRAPRRRNALDDATSGKRRVDNIIEGLTSTSRTPKREAHHVSSVALEFMKHEHHNWKEKHRSTQSEKKASAAFRIKSLLRSWYITKKLSRAFHVLSVAMYNGRRHEETREHHARELARQQKHHEHREKSWREAQHKVAVGLTAERRGRIVATVVRYRFKEKRERGLRHALRVWHVGITRSNIDAEGCVRGIGLVSRAWRRQWRRVLAASLSTWRSRAVVEERNRFALVRGLGAVRRALERGHAVRSRVALKAWAANARRSRVAEASKAQAALLVGRVAKRWSGGALGRGWARALGPALRSWRLHRDAAIRREAEALVAKRRAEAAAMKCRLRFLRALEHRAWNAWVGHVGERKRLRSALKHATLRFRHSKVAPALGTWRLFAQKAADADRDGRNKSRSATMVDRAIRRASRRRLAAAVHTWKDVLKTDSERSLLARLEAQSRRNDLFARIATSVHDPLRALKRLERLDVWPAVRTWKENFAALRDAEVSAARMAKGALRAMTSVETRWLRRGMASWRARRDASRRVQKLVARWKASKLAAGVRTWRDHGRARKCLKDAAALVAKALGRMKKVEVAAAWRAWELARRAWLEERRAAGLGHRARREGLLKAVKLFRDASLRALNGRWRAWASAARSEKARRAKMRRVILRCLHAALATATTQWARAARAATASRRKILKVVSKLRHRATAAGFGTWARAARAGAALEAKMVRVILRLGHRATAGGFGKWRAFVETDRGAERSVLRVLGKLGHRAQARAFRAWFDACKRERRLEQRVLHVLLKMVHRAAAAGFRRWAFVDRSLRRVESRVRRVLSRMSHRRLVAALNQWKLVEAFASQLETKVFRVVGKLSNRAAAAAFRQWASVHRSAARLEARVLRVVCRMAHIKLWAAFDVWAAKAAERRAGERKMARFVRRLSHRAAGAAMRQWVDVQRFERRAEAKIGKTLRRMEHRSAGLAWTQWRNVVAAALRGEARVLRCLGRMGHRAAALALMRWAAVVAHLDRVDDLLRAALLKMSHRRHAAALRRWTFAVRVALANERKMERWVLANCRAADVELKTRRVVLRLSHRHIGAAFRAWRAACECLRDVERKMRRALGKLTHRKAAGAFRRWAATARGEARLEARMRRALSKMSHRKANEAVRQWAAVVAAERAKEATMTRALLKMLASMEAAGWRRWVYVFRRSADVERKMTRVLKHVLNAFAAAGWNQWVAQVARLADAEATVVRVLKHMLHRATSQAWRAWHGRVVELRVLSIHASAVRESAKVRHHRMTRAVYNRCHSKGRRLVALAFGTWLRHGNLLAEWRASQERACAVSDRCLRKLVARGLAKGLRQWVRAVGSEKRDRLDVLRRIGRCVHDPVVRALRRLNALDAWTGWRTWVLATAELRALAERQRAACDVVLRLFADGDARKRRAGWLKQAAGFSAWVDVYMRALDRDRAGALALRALRQLARRDLARALHTWVGFLAAAEVASREAHVRDLTRSRARARAARLVLRQGDRALAAGLRRWAEAVRDRRRAEAIVVKTLSHMSHRTLHLAWMAWRAAARAATEALHALALRFEGQRLRLRSILQVAEARAKLDAMRGLMRWISFASRSRHATARDPSASRWPSACSAAARAAR
ncbi:hypothetical protein JL722_1604 [Aureococcus anophagefferens]|nr:hypothetical protein JL722_1604 [Aureococcus anophagefferens]